MEKLLNQISIQTSRGGRVFKRPCRSFFKSLALACLLILTPLLVLSCGGSASGGSPTYYSVIFDTDGGSEIPSQTVEAGGKAAEPAQNPTKANCTFAGWYTDKNFNTRFDFDREITRPLTIYARWQADPDFYLVSFVTNINVTIESQTIQEGKKAAAPQETLEREKYKFAGWYTDQTFNSPFDFESPVDSNLTLYAKWNAVYTITFSGADVESQSVEKGEKAVKPADPVSSDGALFGGWYIKDDYSTAFDFDSPIYENKIIYAKWIDSWTVTFNGTSDIQPVTVRPNKKVTRPSNPADQNNKTFDNWYADAAFTTLFDFDTPITKDTTIYAKWLTTFIVSFDSVGGSKVESVKVVQGKTLTKPSDPTRGSRPFAGWYIDAAYTEAFDFATKTITRDTTLYAKWAMPEGVDNAITIKVTKADLDVTKTDNGMTMAGTKKYTFTCHTGDGVCDWYVNNVRRSSNASSYEFERNGMGGLSADYTVEARKQINGIWYSWTAILSL